MAVIRMVTRVLDPPPATATHPGTVVRRACGDADGAAIAAVIESSRDGGFPVPAAVGMRAELASRPGREARAWLALAGDEPVGLAAAVVAAAGQRLRHSISWLLVARHARRRGVGAALVAAALRDARDRGVDEVWVETRADWSAARAFWAAQGFRAAE